MSDKVNSTTESRNWGMRHCTALIATPWLENKQNHKCLPLVCLFYKHNRILEVSCLKSILWLILIQRVTILEFNHSFPMSAFSCLGSALLSRYCFLHHSAGISVDTCPVGRRVTEKRPIKRRQKASVHIPQSDLNSRCQTGCLRARSEDSLPW